MHNVENIRSLIAKQYQSDNATRKTHRKPRAPPQPPIEDRRCLLTERKPMLDSRNVHTVTQPPKNHIRRNISSVKVTQHRQHPPIIQDSPNGHRQDINRAGLQLKYVFKKDYGQTPRYIRRRTLDNTITPDQQPEQSTRYVDDTEKEAVLNGLRNNLKEAQRQYHALPIITDTLSKRDRKIRLENLLVKLQQDIETLENHRIVIIND